MKLRALIADDEALSRARLRDLLRAEPNQLVAECSDGKVALDAIREKSPDSSSWTSGCLNSTASLALKL